MLCPIKVNSNTIELTVHTSCYWVLGLLCVKQKSIHRKTIKWTDSQTDNRKQKKDRTNMNGQTDREKS